VWHKLLLTHVYNKSSWLGPVFIKLLKESVYSTTRTESFDPTRTEPSIFWTWDISMLTEVVSKQHSYHCHILSRETCPGHDHWKIANLVLNNNHLKCIYLLKFTGVNVMVMVFNPTFINYQLYRGCQLYWLRKLEYPEKATDLPQVTDKLYHIVLYQVTKPAYPFNSMLYKF
jgi:hypothetical protein